MVGAQYSHFAPAWGTDGGTRQDLILQRHGQGACSSASAVRPVARCLLLALLEQVYKAMSSEYGRDTLAAVESDWEIDGSSGVCPEETFKTVIFELAQTWMPGHNAVKCAPHGECHPRARVSSGSILPQVPELSAHAAGCHHRAASGGAPLPRPRRGGDKQRAATGVPHHQRGCARQPVSCCACARVACPRLLTCIASRALVGAV